MKKLNTIIFTALILVLFSCSNSKKEKQETTTQTKIVNHIEVSDFYGTRRCITCKAIEANTLFTLEKYFSEELKTGKIIFNKIDVDKQINYKMAEKYQATGTSLFITLYKNNKEEIIDITDFAFLKGKNKEEFSNALKNRLLNELKKI